MQAFGASGSLGGTTFTDADSITLTLVGDTANVTGTVFQSNTVGTFTVSISGIGTATFTDAMELIVDHIPPPSLAAAAFGDLTSNGTVLGGFNSDFYSYNLEDASFPITGIGVFDVSANTTAGVFVLTNLNSPIPGFFMANGPGLVPQSIPEPAINALLSLGLLGIVGYRILGRH